MGEHTTLADASLLGTTHDVLPDGGMALYEQAVGSGTRIVAISAYLDSTQTGAAALARAIVYDADGQLLGAGASTPIENTSPEWIQLPLLDENPGGIEVTGTIRFGIHATGGVRIYGPEDEGGLRATSDYNSGAPATLPATTADLTPALVAPYITPWTPPSVDDLHLARLAFPSAQAALSATAPDPRTRRTVRCSWHGTYLDEEPQGASFAIVQRNGELSDLLGDRIKVTEARSGRSVYAFVHRETDLDLDDGEQISLTRRLYGALAPLATDSLLVTVEELGPTL